MLKKFGHRLNQSAPQMPTAVPPPITLALIEPAEVISIPPIAPGAARIPCRDVAAFQRRATRYRAEPQETGSGQHDFGIRAEIDKQGRQAAREKFGREQGGRKVTADQSSQNGKVVSTVRLTSPRRRRQTEGLGERRSVRRLASSSSPRLSNAAVMTVLPATIHSPI